MRAMQGRRVRRAGWRRQGGFIVSFEAFLFATVVVLGTVVGLVNVRDSFNAELLDTANMIEGAILVPYFSDPNRGAGPAVVPQTFDYSVPPVAEGAS